MKKIIHKAILLTLLVVYTVFSTGIFISIHHCCLHCHEKTEQVHCDCVNHHDEKSHTCTLDQHHHCHDDHFFFKIIDNYDKKERFFAISLHLQQLFIGQYHKILYDTTLSHIVYKEFDDGSPFLIKQGRTFAELHQQRVLYA